MSADTHSALGRAKLTVGQRVGLLEADREAQSRVITALVEGGKTFTPEQVGQIRAAFREELADAGLRLDDATHQDEAREDFRFLRWLRRLKDGIASKIGNAIITALIVVCFAIIGSGFWQWINSGGR